MEQRNDPLTGVIAHYNRLHRQIVMGYFVRIQHLYN